MSHSLIKVTAKRICSKIGEPRKPCIPLRGLPATANQSQGFRAERVQRQARSQDLLPQDLAPHFIPSRHGPILLFSPEPKSQSWCPAQGGQTSLRRSLASLCDRPLVLLQTLRSWFQVCCSRCDEPGVLFPVSRIQLRATPVQTHTGNNFVPTHQKEHQGTQTPAF